MSQGMNIGSLEHVNVRTAKLPQMIKWYEEVLGMRNGWRPNFPFAGAWMYSGDNKPTVHLVEVKEEPTQGLRLEHFAFSATGMKACVERCKQHKVEYELIAVKGRGPRPGQRLRSRRQPHPHRLPRARGR